MHSCKHLRGNSYEMKLLLMKMSLQQENQAKRDNITKELYEQGFSLTEMYSMQLLLGLLKFARRLVRITIVC